MTLPLDVLGGHGGAVITHLLPTSVVGSSNPGLYVGKLVVTHHWLAGYSTEPRPTVCTSLFCPQNYQL